MTGGAHRPPGAADRAVFLGHVLGVVLVAAMLCVAVWAAVVGQWLVASFAVVMIGLSAWDWRVRRHRCSKCRKLQ